jgi:hypothetical protein
MIDFSYICIHGIPGAFPPCPTSIRRSVAPLTALRPQWPDCLAVVYRRSCYLEVGGLLSLRWVLLSVMFCRSKCSAAPGSGLAREGKEA